MSPPSRPRYPKSPQRRSEPAPPALRHYAMTPPAFFTVEYAINPWMDPSYPVDADLAITSGRPFATPISAGPHRRTGRARRRAAGHGLCRQRRPHRRRQGRRRRFAYPQRAGKPCLRRVDGRARLSRRPHPAHQRRPGRPAGRRSMVLAGFGFRTDRRAHHEIAELIGMPLISLELVDPRFYHLDTALAVSTTPPSRTTRRHSAQSRAPACWTFFPTLSR